MQIQAKINKTKNQKVNAAFIRKKKNKFETLNHISK